MDKEKRIKEIEWEFTKLGLIDAVPILMLGLAMHARFAEGVEPVFEFLKNETTVNAMFMVSILIIVVCAIKAFRLSGERRRLEND